MKTNRRSGEQPKPLPSRCGFGSGHGSGRTPLPIVWKRLDSGLKTVYTAAVTAVVMAAVPAAVHQMRCIVITVF